MLDPYVRYVSCQWCGKGFADDCGDLFCSSRCETEYEKEYAECKGCGDEVGESNLNEHGLCESCEEEAEEESE
jgi:hypothetical protein